MKQASYIFLFLSIFINVRSQNSIADSIANSAIEMYDNKDYDAALAEFEKSLKIQITNEIAIIGKVNTLIKKEKTKEALEYVDKNIASNTNSPISHFARGLIFNNKEQYKKAIEDFDFALENGKGDQISQAYIYRGMANQGLREFDKAIEDFSTYIKMDPTNTNALYYRGFVYYLLEDYDNAIIDFDKVLSIDENNAYAYYNLGMSYYRTNKLILACKNFQEACQLKVTNACKMIITNCTKNF